MSILSGLYFYPIKSCGGIALREATVTTAGLMSKCVRDREWMVVDADGHFLTQREYPKMALIAPHIGADTLELHAPGMRQLDIPLDRPPPNTASALNVHIWNDRITACDCGETAAAWFSDALGVQCRLVRFGPAEKRAADPEWTDGIDAQALFADGYPMLVISQASLADLNQKLMARGRAALPMNRFRPNLVIDGIAAFEEEYADSIKIGDAVLKPVKPCPRCPIPSIDQATGEAGPDPLDILQTYRTNARVGGSITFGMNAILLAGEGRVLRVGQEIDVDLAF